MSPKALTRIRRTHLKEALSKFRKKLERALWEVEEKLCSERKQKFNPKAQLFIKNDEESNFMFLNFYIWMQRYHVSLEFIVETLLRWWRLRRRTQRGIISFGLPVAQLTGPTARKIVEEAVQRAFPAGENIVIINQPRPRLYRIADFDNAYQMIQQYSIAMEKSRRDFERKMEQHQRMRRNYRKI